MSAIRRPLRARSLVVALAALAVAAAPAEAQLGGLKDRLKQKAAEKIADRAVEKAAGQVPGGADSAAAPAASPAAAPAARRAPAAPAAEREPSVLPLIDANLDRLVAALAAEGEARREAAAAKAANEKARDAHGVCYSNAMVSPEYQKLGEKASALSDKGDQAGAQKVMMDEMPALIESKCGKGPEHYSEPREEIRRKALAAGRFTDWQYSVIEERVLPFCQIAARGPHYLKRDARLVYTAEEEAALKPRCAALMQAYEAVR